MDIENKEDIADLVKLLGLQAKNYESAAADVIEHLLAYKESAESQIKEYQKATELSGKVNSKLMRELMDKPAVAVPVELNCPQCGAAHIDEGEWTTRLHKTHQCQNCGHEWRPFECPTVGVAPSHSQQSSDKDKLLEIGYLALCLDVFDDEEAKIRQKIFDIVKEQCGITDKELFSLPYKYIDRFQCHESDQQNKNTEGK